jgi:phosphate starvation-inducible membrane PsiE
MDKQLKDLDNTGNFLVGIFHRIALFGIGGATVYAAGWEFFAMFQKHHASIQDLLLLFIYLEIGAMVGIYFKTNHMPVRFLIYIAITAMTRHLVDLVSHGKDLMLEILAMSGTTFVLALSVLIIRIASNKYPSDRKDEVA